MKTIKLKEILVLADSGVWGEEGSLNIDFPVLRSTNIIDFKLNLQDTAWRKLSGKDLNSKVLKDGDIIVTKSSGSPELIGKCCLFTQPQDKRKYYFSNFMLRLRPNQDLAEPKWIYYWLISESGRQILKRINNTTSGLRNLNIKLYLEQTIPLPPLSEQKRIVAILDKADAVRRKRQETIRLLDEFLRSMFLEMFGDPVKNEKGWEVGTIGDVTLETQYGTSKKATEEKSTYPILRMNNITYDGAWDFSSLKYIDLDEIEQEKYLVKKGELLFNRTNSKELVGKTAVFREDEPMAFAGYLIKLIPNQKANSEFIAAYLNSPHGKRILLSMAKNIVGMANINAEELKKIKIIIPPVELQNQYAKIVERVLHKKKLFERSLIEMENCFNSLMQKAFRGEL
ncbi:MAG: restriction endonuclease [Firmicutes bacterium]|nr:restriction endonuclease [Bacillota bacterium]